MSYQNFLSDIAIKYDLSGDEKEAFLLEFEDFKSNKNQTKLAQDLQVSPATLEARMTSIYNKFSKSCTGLNIKSKGKLKVLGYWLQQQYEGQDRVLPLQPIDWRKETKKMLDDLKKLTTESLTAGDGIRFEFDNIFVPLGVVERQEKPKRKQEDGSPDRGSELYAEKVTPISHDVFFEDVLLRGNTKISQGKRIAVIGEAGAGKTTQLQKIGSWLLEETEYIPVWISLTALGTNNLREYLLEDWVRDASEEMAAPQAWKDSLGEAIKAGKVWLLLDGVDEMTVSNPLSHLSTQLREGWLKDIRVVITCRVNVWDAGKNALTDFDVYRNLDFDYPNDVYKFIENWFASAPELAEKLKQALEQSGKERIRDMVKNPLRLTLLCYSWQKQQGELPETKAGLYDWFVDAFYEWNKGKTKIELTRSKRDELNRELGELAKLAIDGEDSRFRLTETFIEKVMNPDLFELALDLNWLNEVGVAAENPLEKVYAFYHPSFQEYFAALAIDKKAFFLANEPKNVSSGTYRIFENKWLEVALFWIGIDKKDKHEENCLIEELAEFQEYNYCYTQFGKYFYGYQAIAIAAILMGEYIECSREIIDNTMWQICQYAFGCFDNESQSWLRFLSPIQERAKQSLIHSKKVRVTDELQYIKKHLLDALEICDDKAKSKRSKLFRISTRSRGIQDYIVKRGKINKDIQKVKSFLENHLLLCGVNPSTGSTRFSFSSIGETSSILRNIISEVEVLQGKLDPATTHKECGDITRLEDNPTESDNTIDKWVQALKIDFTNAKSFSNLLSLPFQDNKISLFFKQDNEFGNRNQFYQWFDRNPYLVNYCIPQTSNPPLLRAIVREISRWLSSQTDDRSAESDVFSYHFLWRCSELMNYKDFFEAWHPDAFTKMPTVKQDLSSIESQFVNLKLLQEELDRTNDHSEEIRCIVVDIRQLEQESDPNAIAEEIGIRIFDTLGLEIPDIQRVSNLKRELTNLKHKLDVKKIAIALYCREENPTIGKLCGDLNPIQINLFTGEQTTEELTGHIETWLSRLK
jgi:energy-coupling factor transporter ATP-binding protein EcfA2